MSLTHSSSDDERAGGEARPLLVLGATGLVGAALLRRAAANGAVVHATTRASAPSADLRPYARWHCGDAYALPSGHGPWPAAGTILSAGPLDAFAQWLSSAPLAGVERVVALGSTSMITKLDSTDAHERALAARLRDAEARVIDCCERAGIGWTLLRPTLIWGEGRDRNVSRLARAARKYGVLVLPSFAHGRRQPIRAGDVAEAMLAALDRTQSAGRALDLPGGETLTYLDMARRIVDAVSPRGPGSRGRVLRAPGVATLAAIRLASRAGLVDKSAVAAVLRMREDLIFDPAPAAAALGISPAGFHPTAADFPQP